MGKARVATIGVAIALVAALAGCSLLEGGRVLDILSEDNSVRQELTLVSDEVEAMPNVESVSSSYDPTAVPPATSELLPPTQVEMRVSVDNTADLVPIAETVRAAYTSGDLAGKTQTLVVALNGTVLLEQSFFGMTAGALEADVRFRAAVAGTIHFPLSLQVNDDYPILASPSEQGLRSLLSSYEDVLLIPTPAERRFLWQLPGLTILGPLPAVQYVRVLDELAKSVPLQSYGGDAADPRAGLSLRVGVGTGGDIPGFALPSPAGDDRKAIAVAATIASSGLSPVTFEYAHDDSFAAVHFGECSDGVADGQYDVGFIDALASVGVPVTAAANLGLCAGIAQ
jgi:hypothetical protein